MANKKRTKKATSHVGLTKPVKLSSQLQDTMNRAKTAHQKGRLPQAAELYQSVLSAQPKYAEAHYLLGLMHFHAKQYDLSLGFFKSAVKFQPNDVTYLSSLGDLMSRMTDFVGAVNVLDKTTKLKPGDFSAWYNLGSVQKYLLRYEDAVHSFEKAIKLKPGHAESYNNYGNALIGLCDYRQAATCYQKALELNPAFHDAQSNALFISNYDSELSAKSVADLHRIAGEKFPSTAWSGSKSVLSKKAIRVGFLSGDFKQHSVSYFLLRFLAELANHNIETVGYYNDTKADVVTQKFVTIMARWWHINHLNDDDLLAKIRSDRLDILIDLSGHTGSNRMSVFSQRAAPIQVSWLGYPHSTGLPAMDYRIVDDVTDPMPESDCLSTEKLVRLANGFLCYDGDDQMPYQVSPPCVQNGYITFGSFNNLIKVGRGVVKLWAQILLAVPDSRLIIKAKQLGQGSVKSKYLAWFEEEGVAADRLELLARIPASADHLSLYNRIDVALDSFPYNGTTTTCEALWMGVPTVTYLGDRHAGRVSASLMQHVGLASFVAKDQEGYKRLAVDAANNFEMLQNLRANLRAQLKESDVCDAPKFADNMANAFREMLNNAVS